MITYKIDIFRGEENYFTLSGIKWDVAQVLIFLCGAAGFQYKIVKE